MLFRQFLSNTDEKVVSDKLHANISFKRIFQPEYTITYNVIHIQRIHKERSIGLKAVTWLFINKDNILDQIYEKYICLHLTMEV